MNTLTVSLAERSYPIHIGRDLLSRADLLAPFLGKGKIVVITNATIAPRYLDRLMASLPNNTGQLILPDGEQYKTLATLEQIFDHLLQQRVGRDGVLIALGGGVIGDLVGFAAATYQRGIDFLQVPTTLLAQVDSSVGGKTAVNHPRGKNMIGAFHQPRLVLADTDTLRSLPAREFAAGLAEVIKYGLLGDAPFFDWLENKLDALLAKDEATLTEAIERSCANKARIVGEDERENDRRALLNLGHTFGHAIETHTNYTDWLHGEAVGTGMCLAADLSCRLGWLAQTDRDRAVALIARAGLPTRLPTGMTPELFLDYMGHDKKVLAGKLRLVLMQGIGTSVVTNAFDAGKLQETLHHYCST